MDVVRMEVSTVVDLNHKKYSNAPVLTCNFEKTEVTKKGEVREAPGVYSVITTPASDSASSLDDVKLPSGGRRTV